MVFQPVLSVNHSIEKLYKKMLQLEFIGHIPLHFKWFKIQEYGEGQTKEVNPGQQDLFRPLFTCEFVYPTYILLFFYLPRKFETPTMKDV